MADFRITNCHVHTFTSRHVPRDYPHPALSIFKRRPWLMRGLAAVLRFAGQEGHADTVDRLVRFYGEAERKTQLEILDAMRRYYPAGTRFVVLPMDMAPIGFGPVDVDIAEQHDELNELARRDGYLGKVIPFASIHPDRPGAFAEVERAIDRLGFRGLKLYPRLGFPPDHPVLMDKIYPFLQERNLPVMTHCSRGGVRGQGVNTYRADRYTEPTAFAPVLRAFPELRVCLAHFGGQADWRDYVDKGIDPADPDAARENWQMMIREMIGCGEYPNLWTDISYTLFHFDDYVPFLRIFLNGEGEEDERLRRRVLFGSDFYMTRQEKLSERAVCFRLRNELGEDLFRRIAEENPEVWLGERAERK